MSLAETDRFINNRTALISKYMPILDQSKLPACTKEELWEKDAVYKYYKDPTKKKRATKNFDNKVDAYNHKARLGVGEVVEHVGEVVHCRYCSVVELCDQAKAYKATGRLTM